MKKSCCVEDVNITPRNSSCSMVLRSDCSHGHSRKSVVINTKQGETPSKEKFIGKFNKRKLDSDTKNVLEIDSHLRFSLKRIAYKSAETYSVLKESLFSSYEHSDYRNNNALNGSGNLQNFKKEGYSSSLITSPLNNSIFQKECSHINNNYITSTYSEIMSRSRDFSRSKSSANVLSDSETEDGSLKDKVRKRRSYRTLSSKLQSSVEKTESLVSTTTNHTATKISNSGNHADHRFDDSSLITSSNYHTPSNSVVYNNNFHCNSGSDNSYSPSSISPVIDISSVQYTPVDRFRWFLWRSIYLKIIKCVNFDVWLLSRLHKYRRFIILFLLLPLLLYMLYGALLDESRKSRSNLAVFSSNVIAFPSYVYSIMSNSFYQSREISTSEEESSCSTKFSDILYYVFFGFAQFLSNCLTNLGKLFTLNSEPTKPDTVILTKSVTDKEEVKSIAIKVLEERLNDVMIKIQKSQGSNDVQSIKEDNLVKIQNDIAKLRLEFQSLVEAVQKLEKDFTLKSKGSFIKYDNMIEEHNGHITSINMKMEDFEGKLSTLNNVVTSCCDDKWTISNFANSFEDHFLKALKNIVNEGKEQNSPFYFFHEWLHSKMEYDKDSLAKKLRLEFGKFGKTERKYDEDIQKMVENVVQKHVEMLKKTSHSFDKIEMSSEDTDISLVQKLIKEALMLYDADKTGRVDYALESGGGSVLSTRCSESYAEKDGTISVLGFPLWSTHNSPRTAIQPDMQPGQCWAFKGSRGFLVIQLSYTIYPTGFTLEHIPVSLSPSGSIDSAPKEFSVWGLTSEKDNDGKSLGNYTFDQDGEPLQYFPVQNLYDEPFSFVELRINSNHGNLDYTCLYRFRVHGKQPKY